MTSQALLSLLADGEVHSGESLASCLGVSRTAIWKQIKRAADDGYAIETIRGKGYRLVTAIDLLGASAIVSQLPGDLRASVQLAVHEALDSTNAEVIRRRAEFEDGKTFVCIADHQTAGRGRRGRQWQSPRGENLYLSFGLTFRGGFSMLDGLSLVLGVAVAEALEALGLSPVALKWPNDVFYNGKKLAGILVELQGELEEGVVNVVAGIGLNVHMTDAGQIDQEWTSLAKAQSDRIWSRNRVAAALIESVVSAADRFATDGFKSFQSRWQARDEFYGRSLFARDGDLSGVGKGIDSSGNYLVAVGDRLESVRAGELSLRAEP